MSSLVHEPKQICQHQLTLADEYIVEGGVDITCHCCRKYFEPGDLFYCCLECMYDMCKSCNQQCERKSWQRNLNPATVRKIIRKETKQEFDRKIFGQDIQVKKASLFSIWLRDDQRCVSAIIGLFSKIFTGYSFCHWFMVIESTTGGYFMLENGEGKGAVIVPCKDEADAKSRGTTAYRYGLPLERSSVARIEMLELSQEITLSKTKELVDEYNMHWPQHCLIGNNCQDFAKWMYTKFKFTPAQVHTEGE